MFTPNTGDHQAHHQSLPQRSVRLRRGGRRFSAGNAVPWTHPLDSSRHSQNTQRSHHHPHLRSASTESNGYPNLRHQLNSPPYPGSESSTGHPSSSLPRHTPHRGSGIRRPRGGCYPGVSIRSYPPARTEIVDTLMRFQRRESEASVFCKRAINSLVKKLQDNPVELDSLILAITTQGSHPTKCVRIQRTLDGRLQVDGRKGFPHVTYAKIWRWPDLQNHQLLCLTNCQFGFEHQLPYVCVNPYHYQRVSCPQGVAAENPTNNDADKSSDAHHPRSFSKSTTCPLPAPPETSPDTSSLPCPAVPAVPPPTVPQNTGPSELPAEASTTDLIPAHHIKTEKEVTEDPAVHTMHFDHQTFPPNHLPHNTHHPNSWSTWVSLSTGSGGHQLPAQGNHSYSQLPTELVRRRLSKEVVHVHHFDLDFPPPKYWCSISYFEMDTRVGDTFKGRYRTPQIIIDGFVDPSPQDRFCLGALTNLRRTEQSKRARFHIGRGVQLEVRGEGDIWLRVLSHHSVFLQSSYLDSYSGRAPGGAVHKVYPTTYVKIFDFPHFRDQIQTKVSESCQPDAEARASLKEGARIAKRDSAPALGILSDKSADLTPNQIANFDYLRRFCILRLSFVKGWGAEYSRQAIEETPCWVEVHLHRPLQLLDDYLRSS